MLKTFIVYGEVRGKNRPRFRNYGKFVSTYTDKQTASYENLVKLSYTNEYDNYSFDNKPLRVVITAYYSIPKSTTKKKLEEMKLGTLRPTKKPDTDNIAKIILDSLNKIAYVDDSQIVELRVFKYYSTTPRVEITINDDLDDY